MREVTSPQAWRRRRRRKGEKESEVSFTVDGSSAVPQQRVKSTHLTSLDLSYKTCRVRNSRSILVESESLAVERMERGEGGTAEISERVS